VPLSRRRVVESLDASSAGAWVRVDVSEGSPQRNASAKDLKRYESLFNKYSSSYESREVLTVEKFQELMHDLEASANRDWDEVFLQGCEGCGLSEVPGKVTGVLYDRVVKGKAKRGSFQFILLSSLGIFAGFLVLCAVSQAMVGSSFFSKFHEHGAPFILGSFGTLSILVFGQANSTNIRVWNVVAGHMIGATCGFLSMKLLGYSTLAKAAAMTSTLACMLWTGAVHPPGGAIALLMVTDTRLQAFQLWYILYPALFGALVLYFVGFLTNRVKKHFNARAE